ncbi:hypothetical protein D1AOALGA4SA_7344 [Olavius algarvensis Delta 1 endosymbiont]|nr:hypothetical protein D1AOALGA4SA_7344 [Olavius algarvensis Delta 1 endosymbiont]
MKPGIVGLRQGFRILGILSILLMDRAKRYRRSEIRNPKSEIKIVRVPIQFL